VEEHHRVEAQRGQGADLRHPRKGPEDGHGGQRAQAPGRQLVDKREVAGVGRVVEAGADRKGVQDSVPLRVDGLNGPERVREGCGDVDSLTAARCAAGQAGEGRRPARPRPCSRPCCPPGRRGPRQIIHHGGEGGLGRFRVGCPLRKVRDGGPGRGHRLNGRRPSPRHVQEGALGPLPAEARGPPPSELKDRPVGRAGLVAQVRHDRRDGLGLEGCEEVRREHPLRHAARGDGRDGVDEDPPPLPAFL
jgi:hypothetical protein